MLQQKVVFRPKFYQLFEYKSLVFLVISAPSQKRRFQTAKSENILFCEGVLRYWNTWELYSKKLEHFSLNPRSVAAWLQTPVEDETEKKKHQNEVSKYLVSVYFGNTLPPACIGSLNSLEVAINLPSLLKSNSWLKDKAMLLLFF